MRGSRRKTIPRRTFLTLTGTITASAILPTAANARSSSTVGSIASLPADDWELLDTTELFSESEHRTGTEHVFKDQSQAGGQWLKFWWNHSYLTETVITRNPPTDPENNSKQEHNGHNDKATNNKASTAGETGFHSSTEDTLKSRFSEHLSKYSDGKTIDKGSGLSIAFDSSSWYKIDEPPWDLQSVESETLAEYSTYYRVATSDTDTDDPDSLLGGILVSIPWDETTHYGLGIIYPVELGFHFGTAYRSTSDLISTLESSVPTS